MFDLPKYFSPAALTTYLQCPYKFKVLYIDRIGATYKKPQPYHSFGNTIHKVLAEFFKITNIQERTIDKLLSLLDTFWISEGYSTKEQEAEYKHNAVYLLKNFFANNDITISPLFTEEFFRINIEDFFLTGKIDRIDEVQGGVEIIDYKTGGYILTPEELDKDLQMNIYALCCWEKYKLFPKIVSQIFLQHNQKVSVNKTPDSLKETKQYVINVVRQIYSDEKFSPVENKLCPYCDFLIICPLMGMGVKVVKERELEQDFKVVAKQLQRTINDLHLLNKVSLDVSEMMDTQKIVSSIPDFILGFGIVKKVAVYMYNEDFKNFVLVKSSQNTSMVQIIDFDTVKQIIGFDFESLPQAKVLSSEISPILKDFSSSEILFLPMVSREKFLGFVLCSEKNDYSNFVNYDISLLQNLVNHIAVALHNAQLYELAITDGLTKLFIHRFFISRLEYEILRVQRYNTTFSLLLIDIDHFKQINDTYGHLVGDEVLKQLAKVLLCSVRITDVVARYGGEEFAILLIECGREWAEKIAYRIKNNVEQTVFKIGDLKLHLTVSIGVETYYEGATAKEIIEHSDKALYQAKKLGRNRVVVYDKILDAQ